MNAIQIIDAFAISILVYICYVLLDFKVRDRFSFTTVVTALAVITGMMVCYTALILTAIVHFNH